MVQIFHLVMAKDEGLFARSRICTNCGSEMKWFERLATSGSVGSSYTVNCIDVIEALERETG